MRKEEMLLPDQPAGKAVRAIPRILFPDQKDRLPEGVLTLKELFTRKQMDALSVDGLFLKKRAISVLAILEGLSEGGITPGLIGIDTLLTDPSDPQGTVWLIKPDRFQIGDKEQDYEWFPEDERIFGDRILFDKEAQLLADSRLITRIMIGAQKGNMKLPPGRNDIDYSAFFYPQLPEGWRRRLEAGKSFSYRQMRDYLTRAILREENGRTTEERSMDTDSGFVTGTVAQEAGEEKKALKEQDTFSVLFLLLRSDLDHAFPIGRILYEKQEALEEECMLRGQKMEQAFVWGDGTVCARFFAAYPAGFRCQLSSRIHSYSFGETLLIAADLVKKALSDKAKAGCCRVCFVLDGKVSNDVLFVRGLHAMEEIAGEGVEMELVETGDTLCAARDLLKRLSGERQNVERKGKEDGRVSRCG